jgi:1,4-alpha-glucan branching enzyme
LYEKQFSAEGFEWINHQDSENSVLSYIRKGHQETDLLVVVLNLTPIVREQYRIGIPKKGKLTEIFNSDDSTFGGSGVSNTKSIKIEKTAWNWKEYSAEITLPPLGAVVFKIE